MKCHAHVTCIGGGPIIGGGITWGVIGAARGINDSRDLAGWSGWTIVGLVPGGEAKGSGKEAGGGNVDAGPSAGVGGAAIKCYVYSVKCNCPCDK